ncbi:C-C motif chemokine 3-like [Ictalurus punctatus]|uniref:C-C motif chemokine n=1 Tax=Ictalurus punctatus TaxID=7998 RepID=A0A2D0RCQ3_ICTPU|nr:C-C motif chemokine 3-like [Ictalurus punctatus]
MVSRSLLLVLLGLACLQSFTTAESENEPDQCCFKYQTHRIPVHLITAYEVKDHRCTKPGVVFTLKSGRKACADRSVEWVQKHMKTIDQRSTQPQTTD